MTHSAIAAFWAIIVGAISAGAYAQDAYEPPKIRKLPSKCACAENAPPDVVFVEGVVVDAETTLAPDGRSANDRQATVFIIASSDDKTVKGRTKIWHSTDPDRCGVIFDYGKKYGIAVRRTEDGALETDACIMRAARSNNKG